MLSGTRAALVAMLLCDTLVAQADGVSVDVALKRFRASLAAASDAHDRLTAFQALENETRDGGKGQASRGVAEALAMGLEDADPDLLDLAIRALEGRHEPTAVRALSEFISSQGIEIRRIAGTVVGLPLYEALKEPSQRFSAACEVLSTYLSPEGCAAVLRELRLFDDQSVGWFSLIPCRLALIDATLRHGCRDGFEEVVRHLGCRTLKAQRSYTVDVHLRLRRVCLDLELEPVGFPEDIVGAWREWLRRNESKLPHCRNRK